MVMQIKHLVLHSDQSYTDMRLTPLEIVLSSRDTVRRARESHLIETAMILKPYGLDQGGSHIKETGMLVVTLWGWCHIGCL